MASVDRTSFPLPISVINQRIECEYKGVFTNYKLYGLPLLKVHIVGVVLSVRYYEDKIRFTGIYINKVYTIRSLK